MFGNFYKALTVGIMAIPNYWVEMGSWHAQQKHITNLLTVTHTHCTLDVAKWAVTVGAQ